MAVFITIVCLAIQVGQTREQLMRDFVNPDAVPLRDEVLKERAEQRSVFDV
jgi:hypothetical protein